MHVIFIFQGVVKIINDGVPTLEVNANDFQKATNKDQRKKHGKFMFLIHQCVDPNVFGKIIEEEYSKEV